MWEINFLNFDDLKSEILTFEYFCVKNDFVLSNLTVWTFIDIQGLILTIEMCRKTFWKKKKKKKW